MSYLFGGDTGMSYEDVQRKRKIAQGLLAANAQTPRSVGEGLAAIGRALAARTIEKRADRRMGELRAEADELYSGLFSDGSAAPVGVSGGISTPPVTTLTESEVIADGAMAAVGKRPMHGYRNAVASIESAGSGDYAAVGPTHPELGRALGKYQIMEANIGPWSKEVLGREVSPQEFMANPQIQDAIFDAKFGGYVDKYGEEGAAQAWFGGPGGVGEVTRTDSLGTSIGEYGQKFVSALNGGAPQGSSPSIQQIAAALGNPIIAQDPGKRAILEAMLQREMASADSAFQVQSSEILPNGTTVAIGRDGKIKVTRADGEVLTGQSAVEAVREGQLMAAEFAQAKAEGTRRGTNEGEAATGAAAAAAGAAGEQAVKLSGEAYGGANAISGSISNIDDALDALDRGGRAGAVDRFIPSITESSASLRNAMDRMGLDVIGAVTFGALSEGELRLAMETAVPRNLDEPQLREWLSRKRDAQVKAMMMLLDAAVFLGTPGNTLKGWIDKNRENYPTQPQDDDEGWQDVNGVKIRVKPQ